jgi:hypothetical protein
MTRKTKSALAVAVVAALGVGGAAVAGATGGNDDGNGQPITGSALNRARAVALQHTGGGRVTGTEVGDEEGYYEVEVARGHGSQVDVHLDRNFNVIGGKADSDSSDSGPDDD